MNAFWHRAAVGCAAAIITLACVDDASGRVVTRRAVPMWTDGQGIGPRRIAVRDWDTVRVIQSAGLDSVAGKAFRLLAADGRFYVYSDYKDVLFAVNQSGGIDWITPRDSFGHVRDLRWGRNGEMLLLDIDAPALHVVDRKGVARRRIPLETINRPQQVVPLRSGYALLSYETPHPLTVVDTAGRELQTIDLNWPGYHDVDALARQGFIATDRASSDWAMMFVLGDGWFGFDGTTPRAHQGRYVEHTDFPQVISDSSRNRSVVRLGRSTPSALNGVVDHGVLHVLFAGKSEWRGRIIDRYATKDGRYLDSYLLPGDADALARSGDDFVVLTSTPRPTILVLRPRHGTARRRG